MIIRGEFVTIKKESEAGVTEESPCLLVNTSTGFRVEISPDDFLKIHNEEKAKTSQPAFEIGIGRPLDIDPRGSRSSSSRVDLSQSLKFLIEEIQKTNGVNLNEGNELIIQSETEKILELPWENMVEGTTIIYREVLSELEETDPSASKNFLILKSLAHIPDKENLSETIQQEAYNAILEFLVKDNKPDSRIDSLHLLKNTTKDNVTGIDWRNFDFLHVIMHGEDDGRLCLEKTTRYEEIDHMEMNEFLELLNSKAPVNYTLMFLSFCFSSGGGSKENSLSFELIKRGFSQNVIGYNGGIDTKSAMEFAKQFYSRLLSGKPIKESFKEAKASVTLKNEYIPFFYTRSLSAI